MATYTYKVNKKIRKELEKLSDEDQKKVLWENMKNMREVNPDTETNGKEKQ